MSRSRYRGVQGVQGGTAAWDFGPSTEHTPRPYGLPGPRHLSISCSSPALLGLPSFPPSSPSSPSPSHLGHHVQPLHHLAEHHVAAVQPGGGHGADEEPDRGERGWGGEVSVTSARHAVRHWLDRAGVGATVIAKPVEQKPWTCSLVPWWLVRWRVRGLPLTASRWCWGRRWPWTGCRGRCACLWGRGGGGVKRGGRTQTLQHCRSSQAGPSSAGNSSRAACSAAAGQAT